MAVSDEIKHGDATQNNKKATKRIHWIRQRKRKEKKIEIENYKNDIENSERIKSSKTTKTTKTSKQNYRNEKIKSIEIKTAKQKQCNRHGQRNHWKDQDKRKYCK